MRYCVHLKVLKQSVDDPVPRYSCSVSAVVPRIIYISNSEVHVAGKNRSTVLVGRRKSSSVALNVKPGHFEIIVPIEVQGNRCVPGYRYGIIHDDRNAISDDLEVREPLDQHGGRPDCAALCCLHTGKAICPRWHINPPVRSHGRTKGRSRVLHASCIGDNRYL